MHVAASRAYVMCASWDPDRSLRCERLRGQLEALGVSAAVWPAVRGSSAAEDKGRHAALLPPTHSMWALPGKVGTYLTKLMLLRNISHSGDEFTIVLEDDAMLLPHFARDMEAIIRSPPSSTWDVISLHAVNTFLGPLCRWPWFGKPYSEGRVSRRSPPCGHTRDLAMLWSARGARKVLQALPPHWGLWEPPASDVWIGSLNLRGKLELYMTRWPIVAHHPAMHLFQSSIASETRRSVVARGLPSSSSSPKAVGGGACAHEKVERATMVMMGYSDVRRVSNHPTLLAAYSAMPQLLERIILVWNRPNYTDLATYDLGEVPVKLLCMAKNSLSNRYLVKDHVQTRAVLMVDDDVLLSAAAIRGMLTAFIGSRGSRVVGLDCRYFVPASWPSDASSYTYTNPRPPTLPERLLGCYKSLGCHAQPACHHALAKNLLFNRTRAPYPRTLLLIESADRGPFSPPTGQAACCHCLNPIEQSNGRWTAAAVKDPMTSPSLPSSLPTPGVARLCSGTGTGARWSRIESGAHQYGAHLTRQRACQPRRPVGFPNAVRVAPLG